MDANNAQAAWLRAAYALGYRDGNEARLKIASRGAADDTTKEHLNA